MNHKNANYTHPSKNESRRLIITNAVKSLTQDRIKSAITRPEEFTDTLEYSINFLSKNVPEEHYWLEKAYSLGEEWLNSTIKRIGTKTPDELKIMYLCGPEPNNDLEVFIELGIRPENVWAIEGNEAAYNQAITELAQAERFIKVYKGNLKSFFEQIDDIFDIIYIDACSPLPGGKPNSIDPLIALFEYGRLAEIGALITNYAMPLAKTEDYTQIISNYYSPRYTDIPKALWETGIDPAIAHHDPGHLPQQFSL